MTKKKNEEKVKPTKEEKAPEEEATPEEEAATKPVGKGYDVFDATGELLNIYKSKEVADAFASKVDGRKVVPSPKERTREDVKEAIKRLKAKRLKALEEPGPAI